MIIQLTNNDSSKNNNKKTSVNSNNNSTTTTTATTNNTRLEHEDQDGDRHQGGRAGLGMIAYVGLWFKKKTNN